MKKFFGLIYVLVMSFIVLSLSGCGGGGGGGNFDSRASLMVVTSTAFKKGESYNIYRGSGVQAISNGGRLTSRYYVSADRSSEPLSLNLEFSNSVSNDVPFIITLADTNDAVFYFNPNGSGTDTTTSGVMRYGGISQLQQYNSLGIWSSLLNSSDYSVSAASVEIDDSDAITITLSNNGTATYSYNGTSQGSVKTNDFIWAVSSDQAGEYWVQNGTIYSDEDDLTISQSDGLYIAHDVRYVPNTLSFSESQTATKANGTAEGDNDTLYVAYYSTKAEGVDTANKYILAALPSTMAMGGAPGGQPSGQPGGQPGGNFTPSASNFDSIVAAMTHSASEAYNNPVLHITKAGTYRLTGTWNGQIWVDIPDNSTNADTKTKNDKEAQVALILDGVTVNCGVAPALVFKKVYECGPDDSTEVASNYKDVNLELMNDDAVYAGAIVVIANGSTNSFTGTNVARLNDVAIDEDYTADDVGKYVKAQDKLYKLDGAFHSRMSMVIGLEKGATSGTLNITSDYEGLDSEMHMLINSGTVNVTADDDGINVNEDDTSVFYIEGGKLTVKSSGGDGIDSNGYIVATGGEIYVSAGSQAQGSAGEVGMDADKAISISDSAAYYWAQAGSTSWTLQNNYSGNTTNNNDNNNKPTTDNNTNSNDGAITVVKQGIGLQEIINSNNSVSYRGNALSLANGDITDDKRADYIPTSGVNFKLINKVNNFGEIQNSK